MSDLGVAASVGIRYVDVGARPVRDLRAVGRPARRVITAARARQSRVVAAIRVDGANLVSNAVGDLPVRAGVGGMGGRCGDHQRDEASSYKCGSEACSQGSPPRIAWTEKVPRRSEPDKGH